MILLDRHGNPISVVFPSMLGMLHDVDVSTTPPVGGNALVWDGTAKRWKPGSVAASTWEHQAFVAASSSSTTYLTDYIPVVGSLLLAKNGAVLAEDTDYTVDYLTGTITVLVTVAAGNVFIARYQADLAAQTYTVSDNFNRPNSSTSINPRSDGGTWATTLIGSAVYGISSSRGYIPTAPNMVSTVYADCGSLDTDVTVTNTRGSTSGASIIWFCLDYGGSPVDGYGLEFDASGSFQHIIDYRTATSRATPTLTGWSGGSSTIRITFDHTTGTVTIYQGGVQVWTGTVTGALSTGSGVGFASSTTAASEFWDDFKARPL